jgi:hypothetical protein
MILWQGLQDYIHITNVGMNFGDNSLYALKGVCVLSNHKNVLIIKKS